MAGPGSNATTYNPYDLFKLWKNGSQFGTYSPRHLNLSGDFSLSEDTVNNLYNLGISRSRIVKPGAYILYIASDGSINAINGTTGTIDYFTNSAPATEADTTTLFNNLFSGSGLATTGGTVFMKDGTYILNNTAFMGVSGTRTPLIRLIGESEEDTIIKFSATATPVNMIKCWCSFAGENFKIDATQRANHMLDQQNGKTLYLDRVHFFNQGPEIGLFTGNLLEQSIVKNCYFDVTNGIFDQYACSMSPTNCKYALIENNFFDKSTGTANGSSLTSAAYNDCIVRGNIIQRQAGAGSWAISLENWNVNYARVLIDGNIITNGAIAVGGNGNPGITWDNISIVNNIMQGGGSSGSCIGVYDGNSTVLEGILISGNQIKNAWAGAIKTESLNHQVISNNIIRNTNQSHNTVLGGFEGAIDLYNGASNADIFGNTIVMTDAVANGSPYGIRFTSGNTNVFAHDNRFYITNGNPAKAGTFTGSSSVKMDNKIGYITNANGTTLFSGNASTTAFSVTHGLSVTPNNPPLITTNQNILAFVSAVTSTTFTVTFATAPATGTNNIAISWHAENTVLA